jgi:hypothetical protein
LLDLTSADRRARLDAAGDLITDGAAVAAALRGEVPRSSTRLQPFERRRAIHLLIEVWRGLGRDLALAVHVDGRAIRDRDLLDELRALGPRIDAVALRQFLERLDRLTIALERYASPELTLDAALLSWPRVHADGRQAA